MITMHYSFMTSEPVYTICFFLIAKLPILILFRIASFHSSHEHLMKFIDLFYQDQLINLLQYF